MRLPLTPSQTIGPFFAQALPWPDGPDVVPETASGALWLRGRVIDGANAPVPDALIESWQADRDGRFAHPDDPRGADTGFRGFGRCATDSDGRYAIRTCKPGAVPAADGSVQAPHINLSIFARGLLDRVVTRVYFADEPDANATDPVLTSIADPAARATLLAERCSDGYQFDIRLQSEHETVFFAV